MYNRDYTKEIGLDRGEKILPLRYCLPLLVLLAALGWLGVRSLAQDRADVHATAPEPPAGTHRT